MEWIRSFRSHREACDMKAVLTRYGFGVSEDFIISRAEEGRLFELNFSDAWEERYSKEWRYAKEQVTQASLFLKGWIACTNTRRKRPKVS